jgi:flagellum-specific ATP synthase
VRAIDGMLTCGRGQRIGIFAGSGVGKSTLMGADRAQPAGQVNVIALIGERGREVGEFVTEALGKPKVCRRAWSSRAPPTPRRCCASRRRSPR